jgi:hypothetical protein
MSKNNLVVNGFKICMETFIHDQLDEILSKWTNLNTLDLNFELINL